LNQGACQRSELIKIKNEQNDGGQLQHQAKAGSLDAAHFAICQQEKTSNPPNDANGALQEDTDLEPRPITNRA
jgi:hypothetical protein